LPQLVEARWWEWLLHTHRERRLRTALLRDGARDLAIVGVPWNLRAPEPELLLAEEEPNRQDVNLEVRSLTRPSAPNGRA
jgi:hypothetical protein